MEYQLLVRHHRGVNIQGIVAIEVIVVIIRYLFDIELVKTEGYQRLIGIEGAVAIHGTDLQHGIVT